MDEQITLGDSGGSVRAVLYRREQLPEPVASRVTGIEHRLEAVREEAEMESVEYQTWCNRESLEDCNDWLQDLYSEFSAWATTTDRLLSPFFSIRRCYRPGKTERTDWLVLPAVCLALYKGESLQAVYPHRKESEHKTVEDGLNHLEKTVGTPTGVGHSSGPDEFVVNAD